jgi:AcrR family transcriptional regulator
MDDGLVEQLPPDLGLRERFERVLWHFARRFSAFPLEANFMRAIQANPHFVTSETLAASTAMIDPLITLFEEAVTAKVLAETDPQLVVVLLFAPMTQLIDKRYAANLNLTDDELGRIIARSLDAVFA